MPRQVVFGIFRKMNIFCIIFECDEDESALIELEKQAKITLAE